MDPITDPRASDPIPAWVAATELHRLRAELLSAARAWEGAAQRAEDPAVRSAAAVTARAFYRALNLANAGGPVAREPAWRRVLRAIVG